MFDPASTCLAKKHLTEAYWRKARDLRSKSGCTLRSMLRSGVEHPDSEIGVYAGDADCYEVFSGFLDPLLADFHGMADNPAHVRNCTDAAPGKWTLRADEILSSRVRVARNLRDYPFAPRISGQMRAELESVVARALKRLPRAWGGTYYSFATMGSDQRVGLSKHNLLFGRDRFQAAAGISRDWPVGRGVFTSSGHRFSVWVNEEDHLRISATQPGGNLGAAYMHLATGLTHLGQDLPFEYSERLGYLTSCPSNVGTGLRASFHIRLPQLEQQPHQLQAIVADHGLALRGTIGEHSDVVGSVFDVSNRRRLGVSALACLDMLCRGATEILHAERKLAGRPKAG